MYVLDFHQLQSILDVDVFPFQLRLDEGVSLLEVRAEAVVGVDDGESGVAPGKLAIARQSVPNGLGQEEVVVFDGAVEGCWGNVEDGFTPLEVVMISSGLGAGGPPGGMILVAEEGGVDIGPGVFESLDGFEVGVHPGGDDELIVLDLPPVPENYLVILRVVLGDALAFGGNGEFVHIVLGVALRLKLGVSAYQWAYVPCS